MSSILRKQEYNANRHTRMQFLHTQYMQELEQAAKHHTRANILSDEISQIKKSLSI